MLKINEIFYSIQGEGFFIGTPMIFIRTGECNLRCSWCDTKYAWKDWEEKSVDEVLSIVERYNSDWICITGGEPLLQNDLYNLMDCLIDRNYKILIETNGSLNIEKIPCEESVFIDLDIKTPSSGMDNKMNFKNLELLKEKDYVKFVIKDDMDYEYSKKISDKYGLENVVFQCGDNIKRVSEMVLMDKLNVRVLPQLHKIIWKEKRGV
jgi:7-carboxy-7-deazaguanine synthase